MFDPFAGSGTLGKSALGLSRYFFLTEISDEYFGRIKQVLSSSGFFSQERAPKYYDLISFKKIMESKNDIN